MVGFHAEGAVVCLVTAGGDAVGEVGEAEDDVLRSPNAVVAVTSSSGGIDGAAIDNDALSAPYAIVIPMCSDAASVDGDGVAHRYAIGGCTGGTDDAAIDG